MRIASLVCFVAACGGSDEPPSPDAPAQVDPTANPAREIVDEQLAFDVTAKSATAHITFGASADPGATLEVGDLDIDTVTADGAPLKFKYTAPNSVMAGVLDLALPPSETTSTVDIAYRYKTHEGFTGASAGGYTLIWPYYCGNLFPCHSDPADGTTFSLALSNVPAGKTAVFPATIPNEAPSYQIAWSIDAYTDLPLGTTTAGTQIVISYRTGEMANAQKGGANLVAAFDWFEKTLGPYRFGPTAGSVSVNWPAGAFGGMEHHPRWHVASIALSDEVTNVHEAAHGWFGDGIRIGCWEDFVLSEGTVSYLAGRALDVVAPAVGAKTWQDYATSLAAIRGTDPVWPQSCGQIDVVKDRLFTEAPYMRGAFFYRALADKLGADKVDEVLHTFYMAHAGGHATMHDMLATIQTVTGYDATACAATWLQGTTTPTPAPCP